MRIKKENLNTIATTSPSIVPMLVQQRTVNGEIASMGVGLHSGLEINLKIRPGDPGSGVIFRRTDLNGSMVQANWKNVVDTRMCTVLSNEEGAKVGTVEHLMAAFAGCGIDNVVVEIDGPEVPIMDGSSVPFVEMIKSVGIIEQNKPRKVIRVLKEIKVEDGDHWVSLKPSQRPEFGIEIMYGDNVVANQHISLEVVNGTFCRELAEARTFGFLQEVEALRAAGLVRGGSLDNSIVVDKENGTILNEGGLRRDDEFVRHKVLDAIGDLYLAGGLILAKFEGYRSGHSLNYKLLCALFSDPGSWMWDVSADSEVGTAVDGGIVAVNSVVS